MCNIQNMLNSFINGKNINLAYEYQKGRNIWRDNDVNELFRKWSSSITEPNISDESLGDIIRGIMEWGFGERYVRDNPNVIESHIENIREVLRQGDNQDGFLFNTQNKKLFQHIASWSKVLAAFSFNNEDNRKFFIYDSRVAIALNIIDKDHYWFLPAGVGNNIVAALINKSKQRPQNNEFNYNEQVSYKRYCESLRENGGVTLERQLFMLGGYLDYTPPKDWRERIDIKTRKSNKP